MKRDEVKDRADDLDRNVPKDGVDDSSKEESGGGTAEDEGMWVGRRCVWWTF